MEDHLLSSTAVAQRLGLSYMQFYRLRPQLVAAGLEAVTVVPGGRVRFTSSSLDRLIRRSAERGQPLVKKAPLVRIGQGDFAKEGN